MHAIHCPGFFRGDGKRGHIGYVRRQLRNERQARDAANGADNIARADEAAAELNAAFLDVGARDVELDRGDAVGVGQDARNLDVLLECRPADVDEDRRTTRPQFGQMLLDEPVDADSLETNGIQHPRRRFDDARGRMPFALGQEQALDGDAA